MPEQPLYVFRVYWLKRIFSVKAWAEKLEVYDHMLVHRTGLVNKQERTVPLSRITDTSITQGCVAGVLGYGNLDIETAGGGGTEISMAGIANPRRAQEAIMALIEKAE